MQNDNSQLMLIKELFLIVSILGTEEFHPCSDFCLDYSNIFSLLTRMRQMACHPDLVLRSKTNANTFVSDDAGEATLCRLCNDIAEDAIQSKCRHIFDRECIKRYFDVALEDQACSFCVGVT